MIKGKRPQQKHIHDAEDRAISADAETQREDNYCEEGGAFSEAANRKPKILRETFQPGQGLLHRAPPEGEPAASPLSVSFEYFLALRGLRLCSGPSFGRRKYRLSCDANLQPMPEKS
jgi:hypothetical protein